LIQNLPVSLIYSKIHTRFKSCYDMNW